jgi:hypothetical protein
LRDEEIQTARVELQSRDVLIQKLKVELPRLKHMQFGCASERPDTEIAQLELAIEELEGTAVSNSLAIPVAQSETLVNKPHRRPLPDHLPRETVTCKISSFVHTRFPEWVHI